MPHALLVLIAIASTAGAQSVTSPFTVSQRLINPAAAVTRSYRNLSVAAEHSAENFKVLNLSNSTITEELKIDQLVGHSSILFDGKWYADVDIAYQTGTQTKKNSYFQSGVGGNSESTKDDVALIPVQALLSRKLSPSWSLGLKGIFVSTDVTTRSKFSYDYNQTKFASDQTNHLNGGLMVLGTGLTYRLADHVYFSYAADFNQFKADKTIQGTNTSDTTGNADGVNTVDIKSSTTRTVRKDIVGASLLFGDPRKNAFRTEVSAERITPLVDGSDLKDGRLVRATMEFQWLYFHFGGEYVARKGFMVDTFNLIPYFFKFDEFSNQTKTDYGLFGGLRTGKGHSVGGFFTTSKNEVQEKLSRADTRLYDGERKSEAYGLSYSYVF